MRLSLWFALIWLCGCSTLSEQQCRLGDWYGLGYQDGQAGRTRARLGAYHEDCAEFGITPDLTRWQEGYAKGLEYYCIPELAYAKGKQGETYQGVCPNDASFRQQFERGHQEYQLQQDLEELDDELDRLAGERDELWRHYRHSDDPHERHELRHRLDQLQWHEMELRHDYLQLHQQQLLLDGKPEH